MPRWYPGEARWRSGATPQELADVADLDSRIEHARAQLKGMQVQRAAITSRAAHRILHRERNPEARTRSRG